MAFIQAIPEFWRGFAAAWLSCSLLVVILLGWGASHAPVGEDW